MLQTETRLRSQQEWTAAKASHCAWWQGKGTVLDVRAPRRIPINDLSEPVAPASVTEQYTDPNYRFERGRFDLFRTWFGGDAIPMFEPLLGPGSLGIMLGSKPNFSPDTVWYEPCIHDPERYGRIRLDTENSHWWKVHLDIIARALNGADGEFLVAMPDLIENMDTLAAMRGTEELLMDLVERPSWIHERLAEINAAFFTAFETIHRQIKDESGGNAFVAFRLWGPGKTCKVQCDFSCMISPAMFREFVMPYLSAQCEWLDYAMYHLDGTNAMQHLDNLLEIEHLDAIEWTPQAGRPGGGSPEWYDLYRRIKKAGKSVQAIGVSVDEVLPLLDAVGPEGMYLMIWAPDQASAERMLKSVGR
jgi:hypothetical protein